jgi:Anti-sigma-K factor rskA/Putative zinc-finger
VKVPHEEFLELCAAATAGELTANEQTKLDSHLAVCVECRRAMSEYQLASAHGVAALASELAPEDREADSSWSVEEAEKAFFKRLESEKASPKTELESHHAGANQGQRFTYRPPQIRWREIWMPLAAAVLLALALGIAAYRTGVRSGTDLAGTTREPAKGSPASLEEQVSDAGHERAQLLAKLGEEDRIIADLRQQLSEQQKAVSALKAAQATVRTGSVQATQTSSDADVRRSEELAAAQTKVVELQKTIDTLSGQRDEVTSRVATLEAKVGELTQLVRDREQELDHKQDEVAKQQELLEHDRDIRELMGARDLYIAEVHDVAGTGQTSKTYGRVFYTKGKRLIFYAYDLDGQPGIRNASTFQAWGRRGPDKQQALSLGVFYEDNVGKRRWVLKSSDPKTLEDIDAVFVTVEPNGGSPHPSGKQLLFAYLRISPNHP